MATWIRWVSATSSAQGPHFSPAPVTPPARPRTYPQPCFQPPLRPAGAQSCCTPSLQMDTTTDTPVGVLMGVQWGDCRDRGTLSSYTPPAVPPQSHPSPLPWHYGTLSCTSLRFGSHQFHKCLSSLDKLEKGPRGLLFWLSNLDWNYK